MNKTILFIIVVMILIVSGGFLLLSNKSGKQSSAPKISNEPTNVISEIPKRAEVTLAQNGFEPITLTIKAGTAVTWTNKSGEMATVNSDNHPTHQLYAPLNLGQFDNNQSVQLIFDRPGKYGYHNHLNPSQTGTVIVE